MTGWSFRFEQFHGRLQARHFRRPGEVPVRFRSSETAANPLVAENLYLLL